METPTGDRTTTTWDYENKATLILPPSSGASTYTYNGDGTRVEKNAAGAVTRFLWVEQNILLETDENDATQAVYTQEPDTFGNLISQRRDQYCNEREQTRQRVSANVGSLQGFYTVLTATQSLDDTTLSLFEHKGRENAVKLRRVLQAITDLTGRPFHELRVLDTGCGEGIYAIELGLHGAEVVAIDARTTRMDAGRECAARLGLERVSFHQLDVRQLAAADLGTFDVVLCLGLLYHLSAADIPPVLQSLHQLSRHGLILDTHVALEAGHARPLSDMQSIEAGGLLLKGRWYREHATGDSTEVRYSRAKASLDNEQSFWPNRLPRRPEKKATTGHRRPSPPSRCWWNWCRKRPWVPVPDGRAGAVERV